MIHAPTRYGFTAPEGTTFAHSATLKSGPFSVPDYAEMKLVLFPDKPLRFFIPCVEPKPLKELEHSPQSSRFHDDYLIMYLYDRETGDSYRLAMHYAGLKSHPDEWEVEVTKETYAAWIAGEFVPAFLPDYSANLGAV